MTAADKALRGDHYKPPTYKEYWLIGGPLDDCLKLLDLRLLCPPVNFPYYDAYSILRMATYRIEPFMKDTLTFVSTS